MDTVTRFVVVVVGSVIVVVGFGDFGMVAGFLDAITRLKARVANFLAIFTKLLALLT